MTPPSPVTVPVLCEGCGCFVKPAPPKWLCPECQHCCQFATWKAPCDNCPATCLWTFDGRKARKHCSCATRTPAETAAQAEEARARQDQIDHERQRRAQNHQIEEDARRFDRQLTDAADACYAHKKGVCAVQRWAEPHDFCRRCKHLLQPIREVIPTRKRPRGYEPPRTPIEEREIDL